MLDFQDCMRRVHSTERTCLLVKDFQVFSKEILLRQTGKTNAAVKIQVTRSLGGRTLYWTCLEL